MSQSPVALADTLPADRRTSSPADKLARRASWWEIGSIYSLWTCNALHVTPLDQA
jgi:hypothetical protein